MEGENLRRNFSVYKFSFATTSIKRSIGPRGRRHSLDLLELDRTQQLVPKMPFFRITLIRSAIGLPSNISRVLQALGLRKRMATVYKPINTSTSGQIMRVKELVDVAEVEHALTPRQQRAARTPERGYEVDKPGLMAL